MRIAQVMLAKSFGGAERYFVDLCLALAEDGHKVLAICHTKGTAYQRLKAAPGISVAPIKVWGWWDPFARYTLHRIITGFNPQVVQAHLSRGVYITGQVSSRLNIPLVAKTHNYVNLKYFRHVDMFIPTTTDQRTYLVGQGIKAEQIRVIPNFSSFQPVTSGVSTGNRKRLVSFGRLVKKKGFDILLKAFKQAGMQDKEIRLLIGGDGVEKSHLQNLSDQLGISGRVIFAGWLNDVRSFLLQGEIFVLPSTDEPFGIAVLEALACGKPVIATQTKGPGEILNEDTAYLVPPNDVDKLAEAIIRAVNNAEERRAKASAGLELYSSKYSKNVVVPQLLATYKELIS